MTPLPSAPLVEAPPSAGLRLDLGCGNTPRDGFEGVDIAGDKALHKVDLFKFPWPWADNSVDEIYCSHFAEHIPARTIERSDLATQPGIGAPSPIDTSFLDRDMFFAFFDECWRILKPNCFMHVTVPHLRNDRAFQDPTHRRFICEATFAYLWAEWRKLNVPQYDVRCNFEAEVNSTIPNEVGLRSPEVQADLIKTRWNVAIDLVAKLKAIK